MKNLFVTKTLLIPLLLISFLKVAGQLEPVVLPSVNGKVYATHADGSGGWFIGGDFTQVGGFSRNRLAHILSDGTLDQIWTTSANGIVRTLEISSGILPILYVGGDFTSIGGLPRNHLASLTIAGLVTLWDPNVDGSVYSLLLGGPSGSNVLFVGGAFTTIDGNLRNNLAYVNGGGNVMSFDPNVGGGAVYSLYFTNNTLYIGGSFTSVSGSARTAAAAITYPTKLNAWSPSITSSSSVATVYAINQSGTQILLGGTFDTYAGNNRSGIVAFDSSTGNISTAFNPSLTNTPNKITTVYDFGVLGNTILVGGSFTISGNQVRSNLAALDITTGQVAGWDYSLEDNVYAIEITNQKINSEATAHYYIFVGGQFSRGIHVLNTLLNQSINFETPPQKKMGDAPFNISASATSGLPVTFTSKNLKVATISGSTVTIVGAGTALIVASQDGDGNYNSATSKGQNLIVSKGDQTIAFNPLASAKFGDASFDLGATASSGLAVAYSSDNTKVATVSGSKVTIVGIGSANITASQAGDANYNAASNVSQPLSVSKGDQLITFTALDFRTFGDAPFTLNATASSTLAVSYISSNTKVATIKDNTVTIVGAGITVITASQSGNSNYNAASEVPQSLTVNKADQTIDFAKIIPPIKKGAVFMLSATSSSGLIVSFASSDETVVTISGNQATLKADGHVTITASQNGNENFKAAAAAKQEITVTITGIEPAVEVSIYPNPVVDDLTIKTSGLQEKAFSIFDSRGQLISQRTSSEEEVHFYIADYSGGMYYLKIGDSAQSQTFRFVKK